MSRGFTGDYELETFAEDDPQWRYYHEFLWPDARSMQYLMDRRVVQSLADNGGRHPRGGVGAARDG